MQRSKKIFIFLTVFGLTPLLLLFIFFFYRIGKKTKKVSINKEKHTITKYIQSNRLALQDLKNDPTIKEYIYQKVNVSTQNLAVESEVTKKIENFLHQQKEFKEITIENYQTGAIYLRGPSRPQETFSEKEASIVIPMLIMDSPVDVILKGYIDIPYQIGIVKNKGTQNKRKKLIIFAVWFLLFISIVIPIVMLIIYRTIKKRMASQEVSWPGNKVGKDNEE